MSESLIYTSERKPELLCKDGAVGCKNKDRPVRRFFHPHKVIEELALGLEKRWW